MQDLIDAIAYELWVAYNQHETTFQWNLSWFYHRKIQDLEEMLKTAQELQKKEKSLQFNK